MRFLHAANINLGLVPDRGQRWSDQRKQTFINDFLAVLRKAGQAGLDAVFLCGVFSHAPERRDLEALDRCFDLLKGARVFWVVGKEESGAKISLFRDYEWRNDVTVFCGDRVERVYIPKWDVEITGFGYNERTWNRISVFSLTRGRRAAQQILMLPFIGQPDGLDPLDDISLPFDYIATGQRYLYCGTREHPVYSPGLLEPVDFSDQKEHGFLAAETRTMKNGTGAAAAKFIPAAKDEYVTLRIRPGYLLSFSQVRKKLADVLKSAGENNIYRILIYGEVSDEFRERKDELLELGRIVEIELQEKNVRQKAEGVSETTDQNRVEKDPVVTVEDRYKEMTDAAVEAIVAGFKTLVAESKDSKADAGADAVSEKPSAGTETAAMETVVETKTAVTGTAADEKAAAETAVETKAAVDAKAAAAETVVETKAAVMKPAADVKAAVTETAAVKTTRKMIDVDQSDKVSEKMFHEVEEILLRDGDNARSRRALYFAGLALQKVQDTEHDVYKE